MEHEAVPGLSRLHDVLTRIHADPDIDSVLQAVADGVVDVSGFGASAINVYRPASDEFELLATAGHEPELETNLHRRYPARVLLERSRLGEQWGRFRFLSHRLGLELPDGYMVLAQESRDEPGAWHPLDELSAELRSPTGDLLGLMYVDRPADGLLPTSQTLAALEIYAVAAGIAIHHAQQRMADQEEVWLSGMLRSVVDDLAVSGELSTKLATVVGELTIELRAAVMWLDVFGGETPGVVAPVKPPADALLAAIDACGRGPALQAAETGQAVVLDLARLAAGDHDLPESQQTRLARALDTAAISSLAIAPLDNDEELAGQLVIGRRGGRAWTTAELDTLREIGRELGWALGRERTRERERYAERQLALAARDRRHLLRALARELTPHFATVDTHMATLPPDDPARVSMESVWTLVHRVGSLVEFERSDHHPSPAAIDLPGLLASAWDHLADLGRHRQVQVLPLEQDSGAAAWADPEELEWLVHLLAEDVVLQAPSGSTVGFGVVTLRERVVLSCQVSGLESEALGSYRAVEPDADSPDEDRAAWWELGAQHLLARTQAVLTTRGGPRGRRVVSLSLPLAHALRS